MSKIKETKGAIKFQYVEGTQKKDVKDIEVTAETVSPNAQTKENDEATKQTEVDNG